MSTATPLIGLHVETSTTVVSSVEQHSRPTLAHVAAHHVAVEVVRALGHLRREDAGDEARGDGGGPRRGRLRILAVQGLDGSGAERQGGEAAEP